jgi:hypothetical protein
MTSPSLPPESDDSDAGWGEPPAEEDEAAVRRLLDERPPHHDR